MLQTESTAKVSDVLNKIQIQHHGIVGVIISRAEYVAMGWVRGNGTLTWTTNGHIRLEKEELPKTNIYTHASVFY